MSSRNDETSGMGAAVGIVGGAMFMMFMFLFAVAAFLSLCLTVVCIFAWDKPIKLGNYTLQPREARAFLCGGVAGMWLLPIFAVFSSLLFQFAIANYAWSYLFIGGYVVGSFGASWFVGGRLFAYSGAAYSRLYERSIPPYNAQRLDPFTRLDLRIEKRWTVSAGRVQISLYAELLNALLSKESVGVTCKNDFVNSGAILNPTCQQSYVGPVSIPSLGIEGKI